MSRSERGVFCSREPPLSELPRNIFPGGGAYEKKFCKVFRAIIDLEEKNRAFHQKQKIRSGYSEQPFELYPFEVPGWEKFREEAEETLMRLETLMRDFMRPDDSSCEAQLLCAALGFGDEELLKNDELRESISRLREETLTSFKRDAEAELARDVESGYESALMMKKQLASAWTVVALNKWFRGEGVALFLILWSMMAIEAF